MGRITKYVCFFSKSFKSQIVYRSAAIFSFFSGGASFLVQISLWSALIGAGVKEGVTLREMIVYVMINSFILAVVKVDISKELDPQIRDGSVIMHFIKPVSFKYYLMMSMWGKNLYKAVTTILPVILIGSIFFDTGVLPDIRYFLLFLVSTALGMCIMFEISYMVGLLAFWLQRTWYLSWYLEGGTTIFGGTVVPLWFYPALLNKISYILPFRYITFEPINFYLERTALENSWIPLTGAGL